MMQQCLVCGGKDLQYRDVQGQQHFVEYIAKFRELRGIRGFPDADQVNVLISKQEFLSQLIFCFSRMPCAQVVVG